MTTEPRGWQQGADRLARASIERGDPTGWFEQLYAAGDSGAVTMAWDHDDPQPLLAAWTRQQGVRGDGHTAMVVGCGLGADAEHGASLGFDTTAFDLSPTAIRTARTRNPTTTVDYRAADLFDLPSAWSRAFDLVVDVYTVQALPRDLRDRTVGAIADLVAPSGTLVVIQGVLQPDDDRSGPPWLVDEAEIHSFARYRLTEVAVEQEGDLTAYPCWRAVLTR